MVNKGDTNKLKSYCLEMYRIYKFFDNTKSSTENCFEMLEKQLVK